MQFYAEERKNIHKIRDILHWFNIKILRFELNCNGQGYGLYTFNIEY